MDVPRRYLAIIQDPRGYPAGGLGPSPPGGTEPPVLYMRSAVNAAAAISVVKADEHKAAMRALVEALREAIKAARLFNRNGMTWQEYDALLARLEHVATTVERATSEPPEA